MYKYIAINWPPADLDKGKVAQLILDQLTQSSGSTSWEELVNKEGLVVLQTGAQVGVQTYLVGSNEKAAFSPEVVVLGKLFPKSYIKNYRVGDPAPDEVVFDDKTLVSVRSSQGRHLIDQYWGKYVAFVYNPENSSHSVVSDPTGGVPCYYTEHNGVQFYFSDITDLDAIKGLDFRVNWNHIHKRLIGYLIQTDDTGLEGVYKLLPGECRTTSQEAITKSFYWQPVEIARQSELSRYAKDTQLAAAELRRVTMACINAWASCYQHILLSLSGGLDSTIMLGCLMNANPKPRITALNYFDAGSDERDLARLAARYAGIELIEEPSCIRDISEDDLQAIPRTAKLIDYHYGLHFAPFVSSLCEKIEAETVFIGQGGDELFYAVHTPFFALDYARQNGVFKPGMIRMAMNTALILKVSLGKVLKLVWRDRFKHPINPYLLFDSFQPSETINREIRSRYRLRDNLHPLLKDAEDLPPGKLEHLSSLLLPYLEQAPVKSEDFVDKSLPLYSQPLIELCLELPTYTLASGGKSRGLVRQAFMNDIPITIASRESKGCGTSHHKRVHQQTLSLSKDLLLDGELVNHQLVDKEKLQQALEGSLSGFDLKLTTVKSYLSLESWLRKWV